MNSKQLIKDNVRRARNLNQQAIGYRVSGGKYQRDLALQAVSRRDFYMGQARHIKDNPMPDIEYPAPAGPTIW